MSESSYRRAAEQMRANLSDAHLTANRANAQLSTGPKTAEGKAKVSLNAVKTGLTGRNVLLPADDAEKYQALLRAFEKDFQPVGAFVGITHSRRFPKVRGRSCRRRR